MQNKICTKCKEEKPTSDFHFLKSRNNYAWHCKKCVYASRPSKATNHSSTVFIDLKGEVWKEIPKTNSTYEASNLSRLRSVDRYVIDKNDKKSFKRGRILKQHLILHKDGRYYYNVCICVKNKKKTMTVHSLIFSAFNGYAPTKKSGMVVDHIDNNPLNNNLNNLQLITHRENSSKDRKKGTSKYTGVVWRKDTLKWYTAIGINGNGQVKVFYSENEDLCGLAYKIALENIDKYDGDNAKFRALIKQIMNS